MKSVRHATKAQLESIGLPVFDSRVNPSQLRDLPVIVIYSDKYSIQNDLPNALGIYGPNQYSLNIDIVCAYANNYADALDDFVESVIEKISDPLYIASNFDNIDSVTVSYSYSNEFETPLAIATVNIQGSLIK